MFDGDATWDAVLFLIYAVQYDGVVFRDVTGRARVVGS